MIPRKIRNNDIAHTIAPVFRKKTISGPGVQIGDLKVLIVFCVEESDFKSLGQLRPLEFAE